MKRIGLAALEEKSFENVDNGRTPDASVYYKLTYEPSAQVRLKKSIHYPHHNSNYTLQEMCCVFLLSRERWYRKSALPSTGAG